MAGFVSRTSGNHAALHEECLDWETICICELAYGRGVNGMAARDGRAEPAELDDIDRSIMAELTRDGRMSVTQVAENVHISRAHAYTRINRLTSEGVLSRFTAVVDPIKAGLKSSAYVTLKLKQDSWRELRDQLGAIPEVHHIALVGGDFDVILLVRAVDNIDLRRVIFDQLQSMPGVLDTQTFLVFEDVDTR
ncbi:transcriptional regulator, AsnC family [Pseudarthrobacter chlorophenolicus A6]|uniref:Transcriptional regulator, AsnC family n=2 Tax=Pseudarthrobacter chlorophenolicus TaxID=85085 RepID=B8HED3_PSECP|nr:transcriptional regulator, AsnC family [Pseudarthrobacter chlorophenolicus A6]SDQ73550.1 DNA-binding transcriptional regulator, Lrp family [Pseudarthrobacter chlorophenolicus]